MRYFPARNPFFFSKPYVDTSSLPDFGTHLGYDIRMPGKAGFLAGGLFNLMVQGQGVVAVPSDGPPRRGWSPQTAQMAL